jgi:N-acetylmuramoyl-L-alanine amidase
MLIVVLGFAWAARALAAPVCGFRVPGGPPEGVALSAVAGSHGWILEASAEDARQFRLPCGRSLRVELDSRRVEVDGVRVWLAVPASRTNGVWRLHAMDVSRSLLPLMRPVAHLAAGREDLSTVLLDPGHGGVDSGAVSPGGLEEKTLTLKIARRVRDRLKAAGVRVLLTREDDAMVSLEERSRMAEAIRPVAFVSLHLNAAPSSGAQGVETYVLTCAGGASTNARDPAPSGHYPAHAGNRRDSANAVLGFALQRRLVLETGAEDRGLRRARFQVLKSSTLPAALVECGFLSNGREARQLGEDAYLATLSRAIALGILDFREQSIRARRLAPFLVPDAPVFPWDFLIRRAPDAAAERPR